MFIDIVSNGLTTTLKLILLSSLLCIPISALVAFMRIHPNRLLRVFSLGYIEIFRSIPLPVLLFLFYYGIGSPLSNLGVSPFMIAVFGLLLNESGYLAEIYRGLLLSIPSTQWKVAASFGLSWGTSFRRTILPQTFGAAIPHTMNGIIYITKGSALASLITVTEMTLMAQQRTLATFLPLEIYSFTGLVYLLITVPAAYIGRFSEGYFDLNRRRAG